MSDIARFGVELRAEIDGNKLVGRAAVFGQTAKLPSHYEALDHSVFDAVMRSEDTDVRALINHDPQQLLGRQSSGTLRLSVDNEGLSFEVDLPDTSYANDLRELVKRGDLTGASFAFLPGEDKWDRAPDGMQRRTHISAKQLVDVSAVTFPAYPGAGVALRHMQFERPNRVRSQIIMARHRVLTKGA